MTNMLLDDLKSDRFHIQCIYYSIYRYSKACITYPDFLSIGYLLTEDLHNHTFKVITQKVLRRHLDLVDSSGICVTNDHRFVPS